MSDPTQFVKAVGGGMSDDGRVFMLQFQLANGREVVITFPAERTSSLMLDTEKVLGLLLEQQRKLLKGEDPRTFFPIGAKKVSKIQGAIGHDGRPILSLLLDTGLRLDVGVDQTAIPDLITWLEELDSAGQKGPASPH